MIDMKLFDGMSECARGSRDMRNMLMHLIQC
jgi:hypothetical protein